MKRYLSALALVLAIGGAAGCAEYTTTGLPAEEASGPEVGESPAAHSDPLAGTSWKLKSTTSSAKLADFAITAAFDEGSMAGQAPVNSYNAAYEVEGEELQIGPVASTKMAGEPAAMTAEGAYFAILEQVTGFVVSSEELQLTADGEAVLVYGPATGTEVGEGADPGAEQAATTQEFADTLVGKTAEEAEAATAEAGFEYRVISEDGKDMPVTADYIPTRVNVTIEDGEITKASVG